MYDLQLLTVSATLSVFSCSFECHIVTIRSFSRCILFLPCVAFPTFYPPLYHTVLIHVYAHALTTLLHFLTVSNIVLVSFTQSHAVPRRYRSCLLLFSQLLSDFCTLCIVQEQLFLPFEKYMYINSNVRTTQ